MSLLSAPGSETKLVKSALQTTLPGANRSPCMGSAFLGKGAAITAIDLLRRLKPWVQYFYYVF